MYLTFAQYQSYGGTLTQTQFSDLEYKASCIINKYTFNRLVSETTIPEAVKRCTFALLDSIESKKAMLSANSGVVSSIDNDGYKIQYSAMEADTLYRLIDADSKDIVSMYLQGVKNSKGQLVLYKGVYGDE